MNYQNNPQNYMGQFQYPYPYPEPFYRDGGQMFQMPFNQFNNYGNNYNYNYGFKNNSRGFNKNFIRGNRNNNFRGNRRHNNRLKKIDWTEYNKLESEQDKKDFLGEKIFKAIEESPIASDKKIDIETIGRITGMIIELPDKNEIIEILENPEVLNSRILEALKLLEWKD